MKYLSMKLWFVRIQTYILPHMSQPYFPLGLWVSKCTFKFPFVEIFLLQIGQTKLLDELLSLFV